MFLNRKSDDRQDDQLNALLLNCTLSKSPNISPLEDLLEDVASIYARHGVTTQILRPVDFEIGMDLPANFQSRSDTWSIIQAQVDACDVLILGSSVWLGRESTVLSKILERLRSADHPTVCGTLLIGDETELGTCAKGLHRRLQLLGFTVPVEPVPTNTTQIAEVCLRLVLMLRERTDLVAS